jgi:hypothetical protein
MESRNLKSSELVLELKLPSLKDYFSSEKHRPIFKQPLDQKTQSSRSCSEKPDNIEKIFDREEESEEQTDAFRWTAESSSDVSFENKLAELKKGQVKVSDYPADILMNMFGESEDKRMVEMSISTRNSCAEDLSLLEDTFLMVPDKIIELPSAQVPVKVFERRQTKPQCKVRKKTLKSVTKRKLARSHLKLVKSLPKKSGMEGSKFSIRLWEDDEGIAFFDCSCEGRMPSSHSSITTTDQQMHKIEKHMEVHEKHDFVCSFCGKVFKDNHLQLNAHLKVHIKDRILYC